ncbi:MAG: A/G-specific adenine glycosylase [Planctomycetes bacterium TMED75]|nr:A/G-specific adenine glycosylase [Planctomycetaceae bacterium]OUU90992.1 MAG: A/G-specific adenine glycosylase [Planctomycetes bacterium TMED75]
MSETRDLQRISEALELWFQHAARTLPWRSQRCGYHALVSEAMLQQTQVARVVDSFQRFIDRFPTVCALADADEQDVVASWQGLGYYRRARNLHAAAVMIRDEFDGLVPEDTQSLLRLPGVGRYTAGAIASIVFGQRVPIVDGNVARVLARQWRMDGRPGERTFDAWCWSQAEQLVEHAAAPGLLNEAMMELGATVCTKHAPACHECPIAGQCSVASVGDPENYPTPKRPPVRKTVHHHALVLLRPTKCSFEVLLEQRPEQGLWSRMWQPPTLEDQELVKPAVLARRWKSGSARLRHVFDFNHRTSHRDVCFHVHVVAAGRSFPLQGDWHPVGALDQLPMANPHLRMIKQVVEAEG